MVKEKEIKDAFEKAKRLCDDASTHDVDREYLEIVRDTLGWVLGHYDNPVQDYK